MLTQELSVEIRVLARQGMSMRAIAQQLRVSRNTVRKYLRNPGLPYYPSRAARPTKLDPFKPYLYARIPAAGGLIRSLLPCLSGRSASAVTLVGSRSFWLSSQR